MELNVRCRSGRHIIIRPRDRRSNGQCAHCSRENEARYRANLRNARRLVGELGIA